MQYLMHVMFLGLTMTMLTAVNAAERLDKDEVIKICNDYSTKEEFKNFSDSCTLVASIAWAETRYRPSLLNRENSGSYGMMQIQCSTAKMKGVGLKYSCEQLYDAKVNIRFGMKYLMWLRKNREIGSTKDLIAAWNAGKVYLCTKLNRDKITGKLLCYPGEYINQDYVSGVYRRYKYLKGKDHDNLYSNTRNSRCYTDRFDVALFRQW